MDFLKWYKNKIESNLIYPPEFIWGNIQDELDINQSWNKINSYLAQKSKVRRNNMLAMAATLLVLISVNAYWFLKPDTKQLKFQSMAENVIESEKSVTNRTENTKDQLIVKERLQNEKLHRGNNIWQEIISEKPEKEEMLAEALNDNKIEENNLNNLIIAKIESKTDSMYYNLNNEIIMSESEKIIEKVKKDNPAFEKLYVGTTGQLANTWLLNEKTYSGLESSSLTTSNASFGSNFGLFIGTNISKKIDLQMDLNILVQNKQNYNEYMNGQYISNTFKLNYTQAALSFRYYFISRRYVRAEHGINVGPYIAYLHNAYQSIDGETISRTNNYNTFDYGIVVAYEYIIPISGKLGFGTGVRAYYGLQNIYSGDEFIPAYLNKTSNASINISFSIKYSIR